MVTTEVDTQYGNIQNVVLPITVYSALLYLLT